jgi:hypothetical protein
MEQQEHHMSNYMKSASCMVPTDIHIKDKVRSESGSFVLHKFS